MGYWLWRSVKTVFFTCIYYVLLFCSGFIFYPYGEMLDVSRGDKLLVGLQSGILIVFIIASIIVILWKLVRKNKWNSWLSPIFSYLIFFLIHLNYIICSFIISGCDINFIYNIFVGIIGILISLVVGKLFFKEVEK